MSVLHGVPVTVLIMSKKKSFTKKHYYAAPDYTPTPPLDEETSRHMHWVHDCDRWRGLVLTGRYAHWCPQWDGLPMDETCPEWPCQCGIEQVVDAAETQS